MDAEPLLLDLDDPASHDPLVAGAKAARLAVARAAGLPALPGVVVPVSAWQGALGEGLALLRRRGRHAAQLQVMAAGVPPPLATALRWRGAALGGRLVVRSSSPLEDGGAWSGAFTSYLGVRPEELTTAVAGCWASVYARDALERAAHLGLEVARLAMAVLVQPEVDPEVSGTAEVAADGTVTVVAVLGAPAPLLSGWSAGVTATVRAGEVVDGEATAERLGRVDRATVLSVARLAEAVAAELGDDTMEWAVVDRRPLLLQSSRRRQPAPPAAAGVELPPSALRVARLVHRFGGATGEELVLPWALAPPLADGPTAHWDRALGDAAAGASGANDPAAAWAEARALVAELRAQAWQAPPAQALAHARATLAALLRPDAAEALRRLERLALVDPARARQALALLAAVGDRLPLRRREDLWRLRPAEVVALLAGGTAGEVQRPARLADRWEPFVHAAVLAHGKRVRGEPAAPGHAAGPAHLVGPEQAVAAALPHRAVCVAPHPLPHLAPLLWGAAALVTFGGSAGAHLVHVARSLNVPAVVGCRDLEARLALAGKRACLVAVDGDAGVAAVTPAETQAGVPIPGAG
jgi:phosphohistidine swiveling domain-containing protein